MSTDIFAVDELVAGRYRIVRLLGEGGMGAVYEAVDQELDVAIALKTILPAVARDTKSLDRLKREAQIARMVTHRNVCRIFDVGYHSRGSGPAEERIVFVTMELLRGESLADRIRRDGPMPAAQALPLVLQMVEGLSAAHRLGVVHRDFKSANVFLVAGGHPRAVVADFGLARLAGSDGPALGALTTTGMFVGTPAYIAPEQLEGSDVGPSADIYALGCVLYEMTTACLPFTGSTPFAVAIKRLHEPPPPPRELVPDVDPRWEAVILRCLERKPEDRFASVDDVAAALTSNEAMQTLRLESPDDVTVEMLTLRQELPSPRRSRKWLVAMLIVLAGAGLATQYLPRTAEEIDPALLAAPARVVVRPAVAILEPYGATGGDGNAWIGLALQSALALAVADDAKLRVVNADETARAFIDLRIGSAARLSQDTVRAIGTRLAAKHVVFGRYERGAKGVTLTLHLVQTDTGAVHPTVIATGPEEHIERIAFDAASQIRSRLGVGAFNTAVVHRDAVLPRNLQAMRGYFDGLRRLRAFDAAGARTLLAAAVAADPNFAPARFHLAEAAGLIGYDEQARREIKRAVELATWVPVAERSSMQARREELSHEWTKAAAIWSELAAAWPDEIEYALRSANAWSASGDGKQALAITAALRRLPESLASDPRIDLAEARAAEPLGDYALKERAAKAAATAASARGSRTLLAQARHMEGMAAHGTGRHQQAFDAYAAARQLFTAAGARDDAAWVINATAALLVDQNDIAGAEAMLVEALKIYESTGNRRNQAATLSDIAILAYRRSDFPSAKRYWASALESQRDAGDRAGEAITLNNLGSLAKEIGNLAEAKTLFEQALAIGREVGDRWGVANTLANLSGLLLATGELPRARALLDEAVVLFRQNATQPGLVAALGDSGNLRIEEGRLSDAAKELAESESLARRAGDKPAAARARTRLARLQLEQGELAACARSVEEALALASEAGDKSLEAEAMAIDGERLRLRGDRVAAGAAFARALAASESVGDRLGAARTRTAMAVLALDGADAAAAQRLTWAALNAFRAGQARLDEARAELVLARVQLALGDLASAKTSAARASVILGQSSNAFLPISASLVAARIAAHEQHPREAQRQADAALSAASGKSLARLSHEALTTLAHIRPGAAPTLAETRIAKELAAKGFAPVRAP